MDATLTERRAGKLGQLNEGPGVPAFREPTPPRTNFTYYVKLVFPARDDCWSRDALVAEGTRRGLAAVRNAPSGPAALSAVNVHQKSLQTGSAVSIFFLQTTPVPPPPLKSRL